MNARRSGRWPRSLLSIFHVQCADALNRVRPMRTRRDSRTNIAIKFAGRWTIFFIHNNSVASILGDRKQRASTPTSYTAAALHLGTKNFSEKLERRAYLKENCVCRVQQQQQQWLWFFMIDSKQNNKNIVKNYKSDGKCFAFWINRKKG